MPSLSTLIFGPVVAGAAFYYLYQACREGMELLDQLRQSRKRARIFHCTLKNLINHYQLQEDFGILDPLNENAFCFHLRNIGGGRRTISLSFLPEHNHHPHLVQIMLIKNNNPYYDKHLGYENVKVLEMGTPFVQELQQLKQAPEWDV